MATELNWDKGKQMTLSAPSIESSEHGLPAVRTERRLSFRDFLLRYPVFLLAFGPPIFRPHSTYAGFDTSQAHFDIWSIFQVGWLFAISARAIIRLGFAQQVVIPRQIRSVLKYFFFLGLLFTMSVAYSPGRAVSAEFSFIYFLSFICIVEFLVDAHQNPPDWLQCIFRLRLIMTVLLALVLIFLIIKPDLVMSYVEGAGIRLLGGGIASMGILGPVIAIVSGYSFLYSLEPRGRSAFFLLVGMAATFATQARGAEIALLLVLALLVFQWTTKNRRSLHLLLAACMAFILLAGAFAATIGADQIWKKFNRGLDTESFLTASGRTIYWRDVIVYSVSHPQGMGYIAGIRRQHFGIYAGVLQADLNGVGGTDNSYMQALSDAGWLSLGVYLILLGKTLSFGWRFARKKARDIDADERRVWHALRCAILMFLYCLVAQMDGSNFVTPLHQEYYTQNILIMLILGASSEMLFRERFRISLQSSRF